MTQTEKQADKIAVFHSTFLLLDENNQDYALAVLQTLKFVQNRELLQVPQG